MSDEENKVTEENINEQAEEATEEQTPTESVQEPEVEEEAPTEEETQPVAEAPTETPEPAQAPTAPVAKPRFVGGTSTGPVESQVLKIFKASIDDYVAKMDVKKPYTPGCFAIEQAKFFRNLTKLLNFSNGDAIKAYKYVVEKARENRKGVFNERYIMRDFQSLPLQANERQLFELLMRVIIASADSKLLSDVKKVVQLNMVTKLFKKSSDSQMFMTFFD